MLLLRRIWFSGFIAVIALCICGPDAFSQDKPSINQIKDALTDRLPAFFDAGDVAIRVQLLATSPGQVVFFLTPDWMPALAMGQDQPFLKTTFSVSVTSNEDLYTVGQQVGDLIGIRKTLDKNQSIRLNGVAASVRQGDDWITSIIGFDQNLPPGAPKSHFAASALLMGTPEWSEALQKAKADANGKLQDERKDILGIWKGYYVCGQGKTGGELSLNEMTDNGTISGTFKFFNLPGMNNAQPGSYAISGKYDFAAKSLRIDPAGWIDHPNGYTAIPMVFPSIVDWKIIEGKVLGGCKEIILSKSQ